MTEIQQRPVTEYDIIDAEPVAGDAEDARMPVPTCGNQSWDGCRECSMRWDCIIAM